MAVQRTRGSIAADLDAVEIWHLRTRIKETLSEIEGIELALGRLEEWRGLPSSRSAPIVDLMASLGIGKNLIEYVDEILASISH